MESVANMLLLQSFPEIEKTLIAPYVPNTINAENPKEILERPSPPKSERNITVYFKGRCYPQKKLFIGKKMRFAMVSPRVLTSKP